MARKESLLATVLKLPWWVNFALAILLILSPLILNAYLNQNPNTILQRFSTGLPTVSRMLAFIFVVIGLAIIYQNHYRKSLFYHQNNLKDLFSISWYDFEILIEEVFKRTGFKVKRRGGAKADGGIDLEAYKDGYKIIIQCKHWKSNKVGVSVVREMLGVAVHEKANQVYIITCGYFTRDAKEFAQGKPIELVSGYKLVEWINFIKS